jgi:hypothetical protein
MALSLACEVDDDDAVRVLADHAATALRWQPVLCGAQTLYADAEHAQAWRRLAAMTTHDDVRVCMQDLAALADGGEVVAVAPDDLASLVSEDDLHLLEAARVAEAAGDFDRAAEFLRKTVRRTDDPWLSDLDVASKGDQLSPARWGRWICSSALRWCLADPLGAQAAHDYAILCLTTLGADADMLREHATARAMQDQIVHDALLFDDGGLRAFVETRLDASVAGRVPRLADWLDAAPTVVRLERRDDDGLAECHDLVSGERVLVGDDRLADQHPPGRCFYGRLVCVAGDDIRYFAMKPTVVPEAVLDATVAAVAAEVPAERRLIAMHRDLPPVAA